MMPPLDVFSIRNNESTWLGPAKTLVQALEVMRQNRAGSYFIFSHQTGHKTMYQVDVHGINDVIAQVGTGKKLPDFPTHQAPPAHAL
jgi:hypothetical protein